MLKYCYVNWSVQFLRTAGLKSTYDHGQRPWKNRSSALRYSSYHSPYIFRSPSTNRTVGGAGSKTTSLLDLTWPKIPNPWQTEKQISIDTAKKKLNDQIIHWGYCKSSEEYKKWLQKGDILPITSIQEFFGVSAVEGAYSSIYPILPNRLSYPEVFDIDKRPELFYDSDEQLYDKLKECILNIDKTRENSKKISHDLHRFDWSSMTLEYDQKFVDFSHGNNPR